MHKKDHRHKEQHAEEGCVDFFPISCSVFPVLVADYSEDDV